MGNEQLFCFCFFVITTSPPPQKISPPPPPPPPATSENNFKIILAEEVSVSVFRKRDFFLTFSDVSKALKHLSAEVHRLQEEVKLLKSASTGR